MEKIIDIKNVSKKYRTGEIGSTTLRAALQRLGAKIKGKADPTKKIGSPDKGEIWALNGVSFAVNKGDRLALIGKNGAGKSTLLKIITKVTLPTDGEIELYGKVSSLLEIGAGFHAELTGRENIYVSGATLGMTKSEIASKMEEIIDFSGCREFIDTPVKRYSSGMFLRLAVSVASFLDSDIVILDEVLSVADIEFQKKCLDRIENISKEEGRTVIFVSHNLETVERLCSRAVVLEKGKVAFDGGVSEGIAFYKENQGENA